MSNDTRRIATWKGQPLDQLSEAECRIALARACAMLEEQREHAIRDREMERLFSETSRAIYSRP